MAAKDYLEGIRTLVGDVERTLNRIRRVEDQLEVKGVRYDGCKPTRTNSEPLSSGVVALIEYHETLDVLLDRYIEEEAEAVYVIETLSTHVMRRAVSLRYLDGKKIKEIAGLMGYSEDGIKHAIERALAELDTDNKLAKSISDCNSARESLKRPIEA